MYKSHRKFKDVLVGRYIVVHQQIISTSTRGSKEALENPPIKQPTLRHLPDERFYHRWSVIVLPVHKNINGEDFLRDLPKPRSLWPKGTWSSWMGGLNSSTIFQWKLWFKDKFKTDLELTAIHQWIKINTHQGVNSWLGFKYDYLRFTALLICLAKVSKPRSFETEMSISGLYMCPAYCTACF